MRLGRISGADSDLRPALRDLVGLLEQRRLTVAIWRTYPLAQAATALDASSAGHLNGKIVPLPDNTPRQIPGQMVADGRRPIQADSIPARAR